MRRKRRRQRPVPRYLADAWQCSSWMLGPREQVECGEVREAHVGCIEPSSSWPTVLVGQVPSPELDKRNALGPGHFLGHSHESHLTIFVIRTRRHLLTTIDSVSGFFSAFLLRTRAFDEPARGRILGPVARKPTNRPRGFLTDRTPSLIGPWLRDERTGTTRVQSDLAARSFLLSSDEHAIVFRLLHVTAPGLAWRNVATNTR